MKQHELRSFRKLLRMLERLTANQLKEESCCHGVTLAQCHTILEIEALDQATTIALAKRLGLDKSTLSRTVDGLVNVGLVERVPHPTDRRFMLLSLTAQGRGVADQINQSNDHYYSRVFREIDTDKHREVIDNFETLVLTMRKHRDSLASEKRCTPGLVKEKLGKNVIE